MAGISWLSRLVKLNKPLIETIMISKFWKRRNVIKNTGKIDITFHVASGDEFNRQKKWSLAIQHYEQALVLDDRLVAIWIQLGHGYRETRYFTRAENAYRQALILEPENDDALFFLGVTLSLAGDEKQAFVSYLRAFKLNPDGPARSELAGLMGLAKKDVQDFFLAVDELFERDGYLRLNNDVRVAGVDPKYHYLIAGWREGRMFSIWFDSRYYAHRYRRLVGRLPPLLHYWRTGRKQNLRCSATDGKLWFKPTAPCASQWLGLQPARINTDTRATVILPVYKGYDETLSAVFHAVSNRGNSPYCLLVINDCGPDDALNSELERLSDLGLFDYVVNDDNSGFVQTCNRGILEFSGDRDIVLLNSDAFVPYGWFDRLVAHADCDPSIATVTPLSNNATICSYPFTDADNTQALELTPAALDTLAAAANPGMNVETPTGVGFCFYMTRRAISEIGGLDPVAFKLGYGEENDFCMRALEAGYKNVVAQDIFVFHVGSVSFSAIKDANFDAGQKALDIKHPNYTLLTSRHVSADPTRYGRMRLDIARLVHAYQAPVIFITHVWGGGIDTYLDTKRIALEEQGIPYLTVRVRNRSFVSIESSDSPYVLMPNLSALDLRLDFELFCDLIKQLNPALLHVNSFAGLDWKHHKALLNFIATAGIPYRFIGHDYSAVSRFYHLTRPDNIYRGQPDWTAIEAWSRMIEHGPEDIGQVAERRRSYERFLAKAQAVEFPTEAARAVLQGFYPNMTALIVPHEEPFATSDRAKRREPDGKIRIATVGAIGVHKGSDIFLALARDAKARNLPIEYSIIGHSDQDAAMKAAGVMVTGAYLSEQEAIERLAEIAPDLVMIASVWPETYCYALSIPLALRLPFAVFDIGAQAERAAKVDWSVRLDPNLINAPNKLSEVLQSLDLKQMWNVSAANSPPFLF